ncbi:hypothetical protein D3C85_712960 [compost metagenome]
MRAAHGRSRRRIDFFGDGDGQVGIVVDQAGGQARCQVGRQQGRITRHGQQIRRAGVPHAAVQAGQGAQLARQRVGPHGQAEACVIAGIGVDTDGQLAHLRRQALQHMAGQGLAMQGQHALVALAHARAEAAGQDQAGNVVFVDHVR